MGDLDQSFKLSSRGLRKNGLYMKFLFVCALLFLASPKTAYTAQQQIVERGPHHDVHQVIEDVILEDETTNRVVREWTVVQSGKNFWSEADNAWLPTTDRIQLAQSGAIFSEGPIKIRFGANQLDPNGAIEFGLSFLNEQSIKMQTVGIALTDGENSVWIGEIQNSQGFLNGSVILYPDSFRGFKADIQVRVGPAGQFHNDVILRERIDPRLPELFQMNPDKCRLEIWHKILRAPDAASHRSKIERADGSSEFDEQLEFSGDTEFSTMFIGPGTAFLVGTNRAPVADAAGHIPVVKERFTDRESQISYLIESVQLKEALPALQTLPAREQVLNIETLKGSFEEASSRGKNGGRRSPRSFAAVTGVREQKFKQLASLTLAAFPTPPGFVMDYTVVPTASNFRFEGTKTYYVTNSVTLSGTTVLEKGTVVKFASTGSPVINVTGAVDCQTALGMPAFFTAKDDDSIGEVISGSSGSPGGTYGVYNLLFTASDLDLHDIHTRFAQKGLGFQGSNITNANIQAIQCTMAIESCNNTLYVRNLLAHNTPTVFGGTNTTIRAEHVTAHVANHLFTYSGTGALYLTNSLLIGVTNIGAGITRVSTATITDDTGIFQGVKAGAHYLADGSPHRNAGLTSLSTQMLGILGKTTTYPPIEITSNFTVSTTLGPQVPRDVDYPDLGAHLAPIDYIWGGISIGNVTLILTNGVAIALYGTSGTVCNSGAKIVSEGSPKNLNQIFRYQAVQEQPTLYGGNAANMSMFATTGPATKPQLTVKFTRVFMPANSEGKRELLSYVSTTDFGDVTSRDSEWHNIYQGWDLQSGTLNISLRNTIFSRCRLVFNRYMYTHQLWLTFYNNFVTRSEISLGYITTTSNQPTWIFRENLFDTSSIGGYGSYPLVLCDHNGYYGTTIPTFTSGSDRSPSTLDFQVGALGPYYYPTSGTGLFQLVDYGSRNATAAGHAHYTTRTDNTKDTGTDDIGFHYVALDANLNPIDTDSDGTPDYAEDVDGDAVVDSTESNFTVGVRILSPARSASLP